MGSNATSFPNGLKSAEQVEEAINGLVSAADIIEFAEAGYIPHFRAGDGPPRFRITEVKTWISTNILHHEAGRDLERRITVVVPPPPISSQPPASISRIESLKEMPRIDYCPGVYFLCSGQEVVYVGQSRVPGQRIACHGADPQKNFDRAYLLPVPESQLDAIESEFIHRLRPPQNGRYGGTDTLIAPIPAEKLGF